ncbi:MAG: hypothetical protein HY438_01835 [DPANN group archaeon]|nr:hypothetical protein [DPANN group archaeon]
MEIEKAKVRVMRKEIKERPNTDEVRITYDHAFGRNNITLHDYGDAQIPHLHLFFDGAYEVHAGALEIYLDGTWHTLEQDHFIDIEVGHVYNARVPAKPADPSEVDHLTYPRAGPNTGAVSLFTKNLHPELTVARAEIGLLAKVDWFPENFLESPQTEAEKLKLKVGDADFQTFAGIVARNRQRLEQILPAKTYSAASAIF